MATNRIGEPADPYEEEGLPATDNALPGKQITGDPQDEMPVPHDYPVAVDDYGTTAAEQQAGEPLDVRVTREEPDILDEVSRAADDGPRAADPYPVDRDERVGRIVETDEGARTDREPDQVAYDAGTDNGGFTAEERAMHLEPETGAEF